MVLNKVKQTIRKYGLLKKGDKIVIGVSGGPDSLTLLLALNSLKKELKLHLHVAHLDHMLRKDSSDDRKFVEKFAQKIDVPFTAAKINIRQIAKKGSLEQIARNARLGFLFEVARRQKTKIICLGHNYDDQVETVLMRVLRGTGLHGLSGILPKRKINGFMIIRPLLEVRRKQIESFLKKRHIRPKIDISNRQDIFFRNRIRNKLLPLLEREYNKNIRQVFSNMAKTAGFDYDFLLESARKYIKNSWVKINLKRFEKLHPAMQRMILLSHIRRLKGDSRSIEFRHIEQIEDLILNRPTGSIVDLPKGIYVIKEKLSLIFSKKP